MCASDQQCGDLSASRRDLVECKTGRCADWQAAYMLAPRWAMRELETDLLIQTRLKHDTACHRESDRLGFRRLCPAIPASETRALDTGHDHPQFGGACEHRIGLTT